MGKQVFQDYLDSVKAKPGKVPGTEPGEGYSGKFGDKPKRPATRV